MELSAKIFLGVVLLVFILLDTIMIVSLLKPGDERNQVIVWKASGYTLLVSVGTMMLDVIENFVRGKEMSLNPLIHLELIAIVYLIALQIFKKKHGG